MANLAQLKMLEGLDGFLLVDKPAGLPFSAVVKAVKRKFNLVKVGHGGSLDALASGLLVLLIGDANKHVGDVMGADRVYTGALQLGRKTDTHDVHGNVVGTGDAAVATPEKVAVALREFKGDVFQVEPRFCSVRREGSGGYEIADTGDHKQFLAHVYRFEVAPPDVDQVATFALKASKGVIVRTLVNDFGETLGCGACLKSLRRTAIGKMTVDSAIPFERLLETEQGDFAALVTPAAKALQ